MARGRTVVVLVAAAGVVAGGLVAWRLGLGPLPDPEGCTATVEGRTVHLSIAQAQNASDIAAVAVQRGLPAHAITIALAAAMQESKLQNLAGGDRDSLGLFQQRPSQGWGHRRQILDPYFAANSFYDALVKVPDYDDLPVTKAAQLVQRSAYPDAYAQHEADARVLASALSGYSHASFSCVVHTAHLPAQKMGSDGLTPRADAVRRDLQTAFGDLPVGGFAPGGVTSGHMKGSAHYEGRAIDVFFRPVDADNKRRGWAVAQYLVANAKRLGLAHVIFDGRIWAAGSLSEQGWRPFDPAEAAGASPAKRAVLEHRDHVHVDVP